jgi:hypothetical protein
MTIFVPGVIDRSLERLLRSLFDETRNQLAHTVADLLVEVVLLAAARDEDHEA